ncbi:AMP-binding protein, partial [Lysobacter sp. 2RAB21]
TARAYPQLQCIHRLFEQQAAQTPDAVAVEQDGQRLTYAELNARSNRLAHHLKALGVGADDRVAIAMPRTPDMLVALLATLKAGGAYVPLDPAYPSERLAYMLEDSAPKVLLTHGEVRANLPVVDGLRVIEIDRDASAWQSLPQHDLNAQASPVGAEHLAYVIYTSGSTGQPKGVMVEHRNLRNLIEWHCQAFPLQRNERSSCMAGLAFDACAWEIWPTLCMGATLVLAPAALAGDPMALLQWWQSQDLHSSFLVTAFAEMAMARAQPGKPLRRLLTGGDRLSRLPGKDLPYELIN